MIARRNAALVVQQRCHLEAGDQDRLRAWGQDIQASIAHADTKASILLGLSGAALAVLVPQLAGAAPAAASAYRAWPVAATATAAGAGAVLLLACVVLLVLAVRPDLNLRGEPVYGCPIGAGRLSAGEIAVLVIEAGRQDATDLAVQVGRLSAIAETKHTRVRAATTMLLGALACLVLAALTVAVA